MATPHPEATPDAVTRRLAAASLPALAALLLLAGCGGAAPVAGTAVPPAAQTDIHRASAREFAVDREASVLTVLVYRAGAMARLGHNHVIESRDLEGRIWLDDRRGLSAFELSLPLEKLIIDDPAARAAAGPDFPGEMAPDAVAGTRANMLGERLLDGAAYPRLTLRSDAVIADASYLELPVTITVKDQPRRLLFPVTLERYGDRLRASGETTVTHAELGLEPFSVMLGALSVAEEMRVRYRIEAELADTR